MTGLIISVECNGQIFLSSVPAIILACVKPIAINYAMFVNPFAMNVAKTDQIQSWWYEEIARIDPADRNSDPPYGYISVVTESFKKLYSAVTLSIRLL